MVYYLVGAYFGLGHGSSMELGLRLDYGIMDESRNRVVGT